MKSRAPQVGLSFLLSQLGAHAAQRFTERLEALGLTPQHVGILRLTLADDRFTQTALAQRLDILPSRLVVLLDELESLGLLRRVPHPSDRRSKLLAPTDAGAATFEQVEDVTLALEDELFSTLSEPERDALEFLLRQLAARIGLSPGVHPAYRDVKE